MIQRERVYERQWPRSFAKERTADDLWLKEATPLPGTGKASAAGERSGPWNWE